MTAGPPDRFALKTMQKRRTVLALALTVLAACASPDEEHSSSALRPLPSNEQIISAVYDAEYSVPDGFFVDERADTPGSYTVYHVRNASGAYELCSDDFDQALEWEAADNESRAVSGLYVGSYENERYFEFIRELSYPDAVGSVREPTSTGFARVFKCAMVNRDGVDSGPLDGRAGTLNARPLTPGILGEFVEYLWQFTYIGASRRKVLDSYGRDNADAFEHTLLLALAFKQGHGRCDRIEVVEWIHSAAKASGVVNRTFHFLFAIEATQDGGGFPRECS